MEPSGLPQPGQELRPGAEGRLQPGALGGVRGMHKNAGTFLQAPGGATVDVGTEGSLRVSALGLMGGVERWSGESLLLCAWAPRSMGTDAFPESGFRTAERSL